MNLTGGKKEERIRYLQLVADLTSRVRERNYQEIAREMLHLMEIECNDKLGDLRMKEEYKDIIKTKLDAIFEYHKRSETVDDDYIILINLVALQCVLCFSFIETTTETEPMFDTRVKDDLNILFPEYPNPEDIPYDIFKAGILSLEPTTDIRDGLDVHILLAKLVHYNNPDNPSVYHKYSTTVPANIPIYIIAISGILTLDTIITFYCNRVLICGFTHNIEIVHGNEYMPINVMVHDLIHGIKNEIFSLETGIDYSTVKTFYEICKRLPHKDVFKKIQVYIFINIHDGEFDMGIDGNIEPFFDSSTIHEYEDDAELGLLIPKEIKELMNHRTKKQKRRILQEFLTSCITEVTRAYNIYFEFINTKTPTNTVRQVIDKISIKDAGKNTDFITALNQYFSQARGKTKKHKKKKRGKRKSLK